VGVVSTTPVVVSTWPTLLATSSSAEDLFLVPRVCTVPPPTQRLSHALGDLALPSRHISVASSVTATLAKSSGHGRGCKKPPSPQGVQGKEVTEVDDNDLGQAVVSGVSVTTATMTLGQEFGTPIAPSTTGTQGKEAMDMDDVNANCCVRQPAAALTQMGSPRSWEGSVGSWHSHEGGPHTSETTKKKRNSGSAKHSADDLEFDNTNSGQARDRGASSQNSGEKANKRGKRGVNKGGVSRKQMLAKINKRMLGQ